MAIEIFLSSKSFANRGSLGCIDKHILIHFNLTFQIFIINLIHYEETGVQIGAGIWCGIVFVFTGIITVLPRAPSVVRIRNVMLIISITFAGFFIYWSFLYVFIHKLGYNNSEYKTHRWLRVTQGFCAIFEISLASKSLCSQQNQVSPLPKTSNTLQQLTRIPVQPIKPGYQYPPGVQPEGGITSITQQQQPSAPPYSGELSCSSDQITNLETTNPVISTNSLTN